MRVRPHPADACNSNGNENRQEPKTWWTLKAVVEDVDMHVPQPWNQKLASPVDNTEIAARSKPVCGLYFYDTSVANGDGAVGHNHASFNIDHRDMVDYRSLSSTHDGSR